MKKILPVILILIMCVAAFCACDASTDGSGTSGTTDPSGTTPPSGSPEGNRPFDNPGDSLGGGGTATAPAADSESSSTETEISTAVATATTNLSSYEEATDYSSATVLPESESATTIDTAGDYVLSGTYGGIIVSVQNNETVRLYLNGATITSASGIAISNANKKSVLVITAVENTVNSVATAADDNNAIHVKGALVINGTGTLNVTSLAKNAIKVTKTLTIVSATLNINAGNHGITARAIIAEDATINVLSAAKDGVQAECDDDVTEFTLEEGYVIFRNVTYTADVKGDCIQADTFVYIDGGDYDLTSVGEFVTKTDENKTTYDLEDDDFRYVLKGGVYQKVASDSNGTYALTQSAKGIKVGEIEYETTDDDGNVTEVTVSDGDYYILIKSGTFTINTSDDAIHANSGNVTIDGGTFSISTLDDGITADCLAKINGGKITISDSYEGVEGAYVEINGGTLDITSADDGINAACDDESITEHIIVTDGAITVDASGDGLDSNGAILIEGGSVVVYGPTSGGDAGMDADKGILVNGGTVFVSSSLGMVETPATNSTQKVLSYAQSTVITAGTKLTIKDSDGNEIYSATVKKACQSVIVSLPDFEEGETYTIYSDSSEITSFTVSGTITSVGASVGGQGGMGGPDGQGGMGGTGGQGNRNGNPPTPPTGSKNG